MMKLLAALGLLALALTAPLAQARALQQTATPPPTCNVNYGAFGQSVAFIVAQAEGFFAEQGLTVCYNQVLGSGPQFAALYAGTYNIISTTTDNSINRYVNGELFNNATAPKVQIVAAAGQGPELALWGVQQFIPTLADVKGKSIAVDAPNSGLVYTLRKLLKDKANLTFPGDYSFNMAGGTQQRLERLSARTANAAMLFSPFSDDAATRPGLIELGKVVDVIRSLQLDGITTLRSYPTTEPGATIVPRFLAALVKGERFARIRRNRKATIADIAAVYPVKPEAFLDAILDPQTGENVDLQMNFRGLRAAVDLRQEFGGFNTTVNSRALVKPARDGLYFDKYLEKALRIVRRQEARSKGKGRGRRDNDDDDRRSHHNDD